MNDIKETDQLLEMCKHQGYVPIGCIMPGMMVLCFINQGDDPCKGCNNDRLKCKGRSR